MSNSRWVRAMAMTVVLLMVYSMSGCGRGIFNTEPFTDTTQDTQGRSIAADTTRN